VQTNQHLNLNTDGCLDQADKLLAQIEIPQGQKLSVIAGDAADTISRRGEIALIRLRYLEAADYFAKAAALLLIEKSHPEQRISYLEREAHATFLYGKEYGNNGALRSAVNLYAQIVELKYKHAEASDIAATKNNFGVVLLTLGERESGISELERAIQTF
jgi:tetratricopeptide (TPR) repeat protein